MNKLNQKQIIIIIVSAIVLIVGAIVGYVLYTNRVGSMVQFTGTVTQYDDSGNAYDAPTDFSIDDVSISVGGGLTATHFGDIEPGIEVGDRVEARTIRTEYGLSLACYDCWIKKAD